MYGVNVPKGFQVVEIKRGIQMKEYDNSIKRVNVVFMKSTKDNSLFKVDVIEHPKDKAKTTIQMSCGEDLFTRLKKIFSKKNVTRAEIDNALMH